MKKTFTIEVELKQLVHVEDEAEAEALAEALYDVVENAFLNGVSQTDWDGHYHVYEGDLFSIVKSEE